MPPTDFFRTTVRPEALWHSFKVPRRHFYTLQRCLGGTFTGLNDASDRLFSDYGPTGGTLAQFQSASEALLHTSKMPRRHFYRVKRCLRQTFFGLRSDRRHFGTVSKCLGGTFTHFKDASEALLQG